MLDPQRVVNPDLSGYCVEDAVTSALKNLWREVKANRRVVSFALDRTSLAASYVRHDFELPVRF